MPLQTLRFKPGVDRESTTLAAEGGWFECDKIRFRSGQPEKIGGWTRDSGTQAAGLPPPEGAYWGVARALRNWVSLAGSNLLGVGTDLKYYLQNSTDSFLYDVTPLRATSAAGAVTFAATTGSTTIVVTHPVHGARDGDFVTFSGAVSLGGAITATVLNREYRITLLTTGSYTITASVAATGGDSGDGGAAVVAQYQLSVGDAVAGAAEGWGAGGFGGVAAGAGALSTLSSNITASDASIGLVDSTTFPASGTVVINSESITYTGNAANTLTGCTRGVNGTTAAAHLAGDTVREVTSAFFGWQSVPSTGLVPTALRLWSTANFGQDLILNPRGGLLYYWRVNANPTVFDRATRLTEQTFTITIAAPGVVAFTEPLVNGTLVTLSTTGALPTGLTAGASYYVVNGVNFSLTFDGAPITTSGTQSGTHSLIVTDCPTVCNYVLVSDASRFVLAFGVNDYGSTVQDPLLIRWSDQESVNVWSPQITNQAGSFRLSIGSEIITAQQTRQEVLVWTDAALYSMQYLGPPYVWGVQPVGANISIAGPNAAATAGAVTYWMGYDKFYVYSGQVQTLPCTLWRYVFGDINLAQRAQFFASTNERYNEIWWFYCSAASATIDRYVIFNYVENVWYYGTLARTAWLDSALRTNPIAAGYNGQILYHEDGVDDGSTSPSSPINAYLQSADFDIGDGHHYGFVWRIIPDVTFDGSTTGAPQVVLSARPRRNPGAAYGPAPSPTVTSANNYALQRDYLVQRFTEIVYTRIRGRQMALRISSNQLGAQWQLGVPRLDARPDGRTR
jgi:hypothetical protein